MSSSIKLYQVKISPFSARVRIIAAEKGVPLELAGPSEAVPTTPAVANVHPVSHAPVMLDGTLAISDIQTIAEYLDERFPLPPMMPQAPTDRARARSLAQFHDSALAPAIAETYAAAVDGCPRETDADHIRAQLISLERRIDPNPWFFGKHFGIADAAFCLSVWYAVQLTHAAGVPLDEEMTPKVLDWYERASARPSVALVIRDAQSALDPQLVSRLCDPMWYGAQHDVIWADEVPRSANAA